MVSLVIRWGTATRAPPPTETKTRVKSEVFVKEHYLTWTPLLLWRISSLSVCLTWENPVEASSCFGSLRNWPSTRQDCLTSCGDLEELFNVNDGQRSSKLQRNLPPNISTILWFHHSAASVESLQLSSVENGIALDGYRRRENRKRRWPATTATIEHFAEKYRRCFEGNGFGSS